MPTPPTLRAWLSSLTESDLEDVLTLRRDVMLGAPLADLDELADRLVHPASVTTVLAELPLPFIQVLEALAACGLGASVRRTAELLEDTTIDGGAEHHLALVRSAVVTLVRAALVWPSAALDQEPPGSGPRLTVATDAALTVNPGFFAINPATTGIGPPAELLVHDLPAEAIKRVLSTWSIRVPTRKAELVAAVRSTLADPQEVRRILATAPTPVATSLLDRITALAGRVRRSRLPTSPDAPPTDVEHEAALARRFDPSVYRAEQTTMFWARDHGLAFSRYGQFNHYDPYSLQFPAEVVIALLPPELRLPFAAEPPHVPTAVVTEAQAHRAASSAVTDAFALTMSVLEHAERHPLATLKSGGIGAREITRLAKQLGADPGHVRLALELSGALDLLDDVAGSRIGASARFGRWRRREPAERAAEMMLAWFALPTVASLDRDEEGKSLPALLGGRAAGSPALVRSVLLQELQGEDGSGATGPEPLAELLGWRLPYACGPLVREEVTAAWHEAHWLGILALGSVSAAGRALAAGDEAALVDHLGAMIPKTQTTGLFGSDLTVVVPGSPAAAVVDLLDAVGVREARGSAATWRFTPESVRSALDQGHDAERLLTRLADLAENGLPQALEYLVRDVARRHGHVGVRAAGAVVVGEDPALLAEISAHRSLRAIGLRQVAPTVLVTATGPDATIAALRKAGYLPVPLGDENAPVSVVPAGPGGPGPGTRRSEQTSSLAGDRADVALRRWAAEVATQPEEDAAAVAGRLHRGDPAPARGADPALETEIAQGARRLTGSEVRHLAHAVAEGESVLLQYRASSGKETIRVVSDLSLLGPSLRGWCHLRRAERFFSLGGILSVAPA